MLKDSLQLQAPRTASHLSEVFVRSWQLREKRSPKFARAETSVWTGARLRLAWPGTLVSCRLSMLEVLPQMLRAFRRAASGNRGLQVSKVGAVGVLLSRRETRFLF